MAKYLLRFFGHVLNQNRSLVWINVAGLAIALAASLVIVFYVQHEMSYDKHWQHAERIYRLNNNFDLPGRAPYRLATTSSLLVPAVQEAFAEEIETAARARTLNVTYRVGAETFKDVVVAVDPAFNDLFALDLIAGSLLDTLDNTAGIALREDQASKLFGAEAVLGQTLTIEYPSRSVDYRVTAIFRMPPNSSVLELPALIRFDESIEPNLQSASLGTWYQSPVASYLKLKPGVDPDTVRARLDSISDTNVDVAPMSPGPETKASDRLFFDMSSIGDIHLDADFQNVQDAGNRVVVQAFSLIAALIMLIACINFAYLTLAKSDHLAVEVGIRNVLGATKRQLLLRYLSESIFLVGLALMGGLALVELLVPLLDAWLGLGLHIDYTEAATYLNLVGVYVVTALLGGFYPALMLSSFKPAVVLKGRSTQHCNGLAGFKNLLLMFQFGIAIALIIATSVIWLQVEFVSRRDPGFKQENLIFLTDLSGRQEVNANKQLLKERIEALPNVVSASLSSYQPFSTMPAARLSSAHLLEGRSGDSFILANTYVDEDFFATYDIALAAGRSFSIDRDQPALPGAAEPGLRPVMINEAAAGFLGFSDPDDAIGNVIRDRNPSGDDYLYSIIGVAADNQYYSLTLVTRPEIYYFLPDSADVLAVNYVGSTEAAMDDLREVWSAVMGDAVFTASAIEPMLAAEFAQERGEGRMFVLFSLFAIFIACLGLYGASTFSVERRTKEIGIRKVMGAEIKEIVSMLLWQFSRPVLFANLLAWPVALWAMLEWLQRFPYQIDALLLLPLCVLAGVVALSIAWLTVASNAMRVASMKPVLALRYE